MVPLDAGVPFDFTELRGSGRERKRLYVHGRPCMKTIPNPYAAGKEEMSKEPSRHRQIGGGDTMHGRIYEESAGEMQGRLPA